MYKKIQEDRTGQDSRIVHDHVQGWARQIHTDCPYFPWAGSLYTLLCLTQIHSSLISISPHIASGFEQLLILTAQELSQLRSHSWFTVSWVTKSKLIFLEVVPVVSWKPHSCYDWRVLLPVFVCVVFFVRFVSLYILFWVFFFSHTQITLMKIMTVNIFTLVFSSVSVTDQVSFLSLPLL